jgi:DNA-binding Lrp family transcriptional regulator
MSDNIDDLDLKIVLQLQENGRATITELAENVGSSRPTVTNRLKRLIDEDLVIVTGGVNMAKFGYKMACIGLEVKSSETRAELEECLSHCPRVINIFRTTGTANLHMALSTRLWRG